MKYLDFTKIFYIFSIYLLKKKSCYVVAHDKLPNYIIVFLSVFFARDLKMG